MASIFTFDPDPPRVSSPWAAPPQESKSKQPNSGESKVESLGLTSGRTRIPAGSLGTASEDSPITKLEAEPQEGPTEYKLHLLLRRRRSFIRASTGRNVSGSLRRTETPMSTSAAASRSVSESNLSSTPPPLSSTQSRQHRLEQLTTQLLWRLQQSCPVHISSSNALVLPQLPDASQLSTPSVPRRILPGLEESKGALYEIGIADDGTFVGLAEDEMEESLANLRVMAASLGCCVEVLRMVDIGECEWIESIERSRMSEPRTRTGKLWVAEAFVRPDQSLIKQDTASITQKDSNGLFHDAPASGGHSSSRADQQRPTEQLRISLIGTTMSGKSSLLGSLSTATLDNGRGKSRLSFLKHRHEIASGMTSSVTQELIGYHDRSGQEEDRKSCQVVSYGSRDVSSWLDIHASTEGGRLVFLSDTAGHPRYRRTTLRSLVGWSPHWTLLCIPADNADGSSSASESPGQPPVDVDLSQAHLQLCLNLELPFVVIITKLDVATKSGLRQTLSRLLSTLKEAGRKPSIVANNPSAVEESRLTTISATDLLEASKIVEPLKNAPLETVPIVLTSAVKGTGISKLHAILRQLPIPNLSPPVNSPHNVLFHIEDVYSNILAPTKFTSPNNYSSNTSTVIGGHLASGILNVGDEFLLGPYPIDTSADDSDSGSGTPSTPPSHRQDPALPTSRSFPGALHKRTAAPIHPADKTSEWKRVRITSLRNLRLPVRSLLACQVGTVAVTAVDESEVIQSPALVRVRKGMVLVDGEPIARRTVEVRFEGENARGMGRLGVGTAVVVYVASVRASAKVVSVALEDDGQEYASQRENIEPEDDDDGFGFGMGFEDEDSGGAKRGEEAGGGVVKVVFQFIASREFVLGGAKVLVLPGGGPNLYGGLERGEKGVAGLEGFVGRVC